MKMPDTINGKTLKRKPRKYIRKCGVCGERFDQSHMIRTINAPNGWICIECR